MVMISKDLAMLPEAREKTTCQRRAGEGQKVGRRSGQVSPKGDHLAFLGPLDFLSSKSSWEQRAVGQVVWALKRAGRPAKQVRAQAGS